MILVKKNIVKSFRLIIFQKILNLDFVFERINWKFSDVPKTIGNISEMLHFFIERMIRFSESKLLDELHNFTKCLVLFERTKVYLFRLFLFFLIITIPKTISRISVCSAIFGPKIMIERVNNVIVYEFLFKLFKFIRELKRIVFVKLCFFWRQCIKYKYNSTVEYNILIY